MIEFASEAIWSWTFVCWKFLNQFQFQFLWWVHSSFLFHLGLVLEDCTFLRICPFLLGFPFYWRIVAQSSLKILCISVMSIVTSPFSFLILLIWVLSLFCLISLAKGLSILLIFSKNQLFVSLIFSMVFFVSISLISALIFMISFLLLTLGLVCSLSSCFRWFIRAFSYFLS